MNYISCTVVIREMQLSYKFLLKNLFKEQWSLLYYLMQQSIQCYQNFQLPLHVFWRIMILNRTRNILCHKKNIKWPIKWPVEGYSGPHGPYYCEVGEDKAFGRDTVDAHYKACTYAWINISDINGKAAWSVGIPSWTNYWHLSSVTSCG